MISTPKNLLQGICRAFRQMPIQLSKTPWEFEPTERLKFSHKTDMTTAKSPIVDDARRPPNLEQPKLIPKRTRARRRNE